MAFARRPEWARQLTLRRIAAGMTLGDVSRATGMTVTQVSEYERGVHRPGPVCQMRLDAALGDER